MTLFPDLPPDRFALKAQKVPSSGQTLRRLFLTLFLRGRTSRGLKRQTAPKSIGEKLLGTLALYGLFGLMMVGMRFLPVFAFSAYLHVMTFSFLGMFVASSAGEILFNKEEADILLHRPIEPQTLLRAKITVLIQVSLWLGIAFNLAGFVAGCTTPDGRWTFPLVHLASIALEVLFCAGSVVLVYELCLRWFGREKLDSLMTTMQVLVAVIVVAGSQLFPQLLFRSEKIGEFKRDAWWIGLFPPAWFAGIDDALAGSGQQNSWVLGGVAIVGTAGICWLAFSRLAEGYDAGLQKVAQSSPVRRPRRWTPVSRVAG